MKFSSTTIQILKNYAAINQNIMFRPGSEIATIATGKNVFATAQVEEEFPCEVPIYDLSSFLGILTLNQDADVDFGETFMTISKDGVEFTYYYSDPSIIVAPPQKKINVDEHYVFNLSKEDITMIAKASAILSAPVLSIVAKSGKVSIVVNDPKTKGSNTFKKVVGEFDGEFNVEIGIDIFRPLHENYEVVLSKKKFIHLRNEERGMKYWYAASPQSVI